MTTEQNRPKNAVVVGGSMGGLLAARVLSDHFDQVTVIERDALPQGPAPRKGVPQGRHLHGFLAGGVSALGALFPDFLAGAQARGGLPVDVGRLGTWYMTGAALPDFDSGLRGLLISRLALEAYLRELVRTRTNVTFLESQRVTGLLGGRDRIPGVRGRCARIATRALEHAPPRGLAPGDWGLRDSGVGRGRWREQRARDKRKLSANRRDYQFLL